MILNTFSTSELPKRSVIIIHGFGGKVSSMKPLTKILSLRDTKWILPQAPYNASIGDFSWFEGDDEIGWKYKSSFKILSTIIQDLNIEGFSYNDIFILGFSQGACLAMEFMIRQSFSLGGIIPIAGFVKYKERLKDDATHSSLATPVLLIHGDKDKVVLPEQSKISQKLFKTVGYQTELHILPAGHKIPLKAKNLIQTFIYN